VNRLRVLAFSPVPYEGAGCRFRISQYLPYLSEQGIDVTVLPFYDRAFFELVYEPGRFLRKALSFAALTVKRLDSVRDATEADLVLVYREMFPIGPALLERLLAHRRRPPIVYDFDDAIFLPSVSDANRLVGALKYPQKVSSIIRHSRHVIAGNEYLAAYARRFNRAVTIVPTSVDTEIFTPAHPAGSRNQEALSAPGAPAGGGSRPIVGWIGTPTTATYLKSLTGVLRQVQERQPFTLRVSGTTEPIDIPGVAVENVKWSLPAEVALFNTCDIGVYPLTDDEWSKGKCGFKAIEFMACGVPVVAAAVGVNREIIRDGENGFLASSEDDWVEKLTRLLAEPALRRRFAEAGRQTVEDRYSRRANAPKLAAILRAAAEGPGAN
jgi:glycosyltransferase involved in cell wall biosynthesis